MDFYSVRNYEPGTRTFPPTIPYQDGLTDLITLDPGPLLQPGQHHDGRAPLLPHQPPKVSQSLGQRSLEEKKKSDFKRFSYFEVLKYLASFHTRKPQLQ